MNRETVFVSAVVYARNDANNEVAFLRSLAAFFNDKFENYEIIVVDDCSAKDIRGALQSVSDEATGYVSVVRMSFPKGVQSAMNAGIDIAIGDFVFEFESAVMDFDASLISQVYQKELEGFDIVSAVPQNGAKMSSKLFYGFYNRNSNNQYPLSSERFRLVSRRAINRVESMSDTPVYRKALYSGSGL
ncbi:MAG: glycosyltransferase, partial [Oscillospiraceae bacterium]|nr:glycosyltransferase [Oscillospiraceae bacterium]